VVQRREKAFSEGRSDIGDGYLRFSVAVVSRSHIYCFLSPLGKRFSLLTTTTTTIIIIITTMMIIIIIIVQFLQYLSLSTD
jgi:hypothetical protein